MFDTLPRGDSGKIERGRRGCARPGARGESGAAGTATKPRVGLSRSRTRAPAAIAPPRRGSQPHRQDKTSNHTPAHATRRSRSGAARPPAFAPRVRSSGESLASTAATRADRPCVTRARDAAQRRARRTFGARLRVGNRERASQSVKRVGKISLLQCVRSLEKGLSIYVREVFSDDPVLSAKIPKRRESVARTHLHERSIFVLSL